MMQRYENIDIARGIAMLVIISWHILGVHSGWTDGWVMPLWFIIMGIFYRKESDFHTMLCRKVNSILLPALIWSIPAMFISICNHGTVQTAITIVHPYKTLHGVTWFFWCAMWVYVINYCIWKIAKDHRLLFAFCSLVISLVGYGMPFITYNGHRLVLPLYLNGAMVAQVFVCVGYLLSNYIKQASLQKFIKFSILSILGGKICKPEIADFNWANFDLWPILVFHGIIGSLAVIFACALCPKKISPSLAIVGRYSLLMLLIHPYIQQVLKLFGMPAVFNYIIVVIITILIACAVVQCCPLLAGMKPIIKSLIPLRIQ